MRLMLNQIPLQRAVKILLNYESSYYTIDALKNRLLMYDLLIYLLILSHYILKRSPFSIKKEEDALLFARYLVEDNQEDYLILDINRQNHQRVIRSVFQNAIGKIQLTDEVKDKMLWTRISNKIRLYESQIRPQFELYHNKLDCSASELIIRCLEDTLNEFSEEESVLI